MSQRAICIHGHFYQPPRENPWLDTIEPQPSAHPYPNWNARIAAECYRPNAAARIVDHQGQIIRIVDNYERMSFDVGPTLMAWLERDAPDVHQALVEADRRSVARFSGHGSAMAQAYNHVIMPLASRRDKVTQVRWGIADFRHRFGRDPESMWLPECAVDTESLEVLAEQGIRFTVLAPHQARAVRAAGGEWQPLSGNVDTARVYRCPLPSGRSIDLFFYDGAAAQAVAFERLLVDGGILVDRLAGGAPGGGLSHIATDGETYGHHHRYGDMALAWALHSIEHGHARAGGATLTNYGEFRFKFPATWEVQIVENSSWSCVHGVERWRSDCGCNSGGHPGWNQGWRAPLRTALDWLRDRCGDAIERRGRELLADVWAARDDFASVVLDRRPAAVEEFLRRHRVADGDGRAQAALEVMELARHAMLMFTSCGWFFDDLSGIETVQILQYAARALELHDKVVGENLEEEFLGRLGDARSNLADEGDARQIWARRVLPAKIDLTKVVAHHAVSLVVDGHSPSPTAPRGEGRGSGTESTGPRSRAVEHYCYRVANLELVARRTGKLRLAAGTARVESLITREQAGFCFAALYLGEHHFVGGARRDGDPGWPAVVSELATAFANADVLFAQRLIDRYFDGATFTLGSLFAVDRASALRRILAEPIGAAESQLGKLYDEHAPLMRYLASHGLPVPEVFKTAAELTLRHRLLENLESDHPSFVVLKSQLAEAITVEVDLDAPEIAYVAGKTLHRMIDRLVADPANLDLISDTARAAEVASRMKSEVDLWHAQNACWLLLERHLPGLEASSDAAAKHRAEEMKRLAKALRLAVPGQAASARG